MGEYRTDPDFIERFRRLEERVSALAVGTPSAWGMVQVAPSPGTIPNNVLTPLPLAYWQSTYGLSVSGTRLVTQYAGLYLAIAAVGFFSGTGRRTVRIVPNGSPTGVVGQSTGLPLTGTDTDLTAAGLVNLAAGDYLEMHAYQDSGGTLGIASTSALHMVRVA